MVYKRARTPQVCMWSVREREREFKNRFKKEADRQKQHREERLTGDKMKGRRSEGGTLVRGELAASLCGKGGPLLLCQFKLFTSAQWKEYSKIKNASGPGGPWLHVVETAQEKGCCLHPGAGWDPGGLGGAAFLPVRTCSVDKPRTEAHTPRG